MSLISKSIRAAISSIALVGILSPPTVLAGGGLVVKLLDGSVPINQPDLFATAYSKAWANGSNFCPALRAVLSSAAGPGSTWAITACSAPAYGSTDVLSHGILGANVTFDTTITVQGTHQWALYTQQGSETVDCRFTDTISLTAQDELSLSEPAMPPKTPSVSFDPPTLKGTLVTEHWASPCADAPLQHPASESELILKEIPTAASSVDFPGSALIDAFSPYQATIAKDLAGGVYNVSVATGDVDIQVVNTFLREELGKPLPRLTQTAPSGAATASTSPASTSPASTSPASTSPASAVGASAWGTAVAPSTGTLSGTTPNWGTGTSTANAPVGSAGALNRSVGSSLQQERAPQTFAAPSSLGQH